MTEERDKIDLWLDDALASYGEVALPTGFEARMLDRLQKRMARRLAWPSLIWASAAAVVCLVVIVYAPTAKLQAPPQLRARILVPEVHRVQMSREKAQVQETIAKHVATRGVPIVPVPITPEEQAILRLVRNSRARQLASLTADRGDVRLGSDVIGFRELQIPPVIREEEK